MTAAASQYTGLATSEYQQSPNFLAMIAQTVQPFCDEQNQTLSLFSLFDLDSGIGDQLDKIGQWIGLNRTINLPLTAAYFSFDTSGAGFDQAPWWVTGNPAFTAVTLNDIHYRLALKGKVLDNAWNGSIPSAYLIFQTLFQGTGFQISIQDYGDLSMALTLLWQVAAPDAQTQAIFTGGYISVRPAGIMLRSLNIAQSPFVVTTASPSAGQVKLTWTGFSGVVYNVYQGTVSGGEGTTPVTTLTGPAAFGPLTTTLPGLTSGQTYYFKVTASDIYGNTLTAAEVSQLVT